MRWCVVKSKTIQTTWSSRLSSLLGSVAGVTKTKGRLFNTSSPGRFSTGQSRKVAHQQQFHLDTGATKQLETFIFIALWKHTCYCLQGLGHCLGHSFTVLLVVQKVDSNILWTNLYPKDSAIGLPITYLLRRQWLIRWVALSIAIHLLNKSGCHQPRPQGAFSSKAREKRPGDEVGLSPAIVFRLRTFFWVIPLLFHYPTGASSWKTD